MRETIGGDHILRSMQSGTLEAPPIFITKGSALEIPAPGFDTSSFSAGFQGQSPWLYLDMRDLRIVASFLLAACVSTQATSASFNR